MMELSSFTTRTGGEILPCPYASGTWRLALGSGGTITAALPMAWAEAMGMPIWGETSLVKRGLLLEFGTFAVEAGAIWRRRPDRKTGKVTVTARGMRTWTEHRSVKPPAAQTIDEASFLVPDPDNPKGWIPNPVLATDWSGVDAGTAMQLLIEQAMQWAGGDMPIISFAPRAGGSAGHYDAIDDKRLSDAINELEDLGPDFRMTPRRTVDGTRVEWLLEAGTEAEPMLVSAAPHVYTLGLPDVQITALDIDEDADGLASFAWTSGGRGDDRALLARESSTALTDAGYPLLERWASFPSEVDMAALRARARRELALGSAPAESWQFSVPIDQVPRLGEFREGHMVKIITDGLPSTVRRHRFPRPAGQYLMRILALDGELGGKTATMTCSPGRRVA